MASALTSGEHAERSVRFVVARSVLLAVMAATSLVACGGITVGQSQTVTCASPPCASPNPQSPVHGAGPPQPGDARASKFVGGNASPPLATGKPNVIAVVATGPYDGISVAGSIPVVVRNNTSGVVNRVTVTATIRDGSGALIGSGSDQGFDPLTVQPGEIAMGYVFFSGAPPPANATFQFNAGATPGTGAGDLEVGETNLTNGHLLGTLNNTRSRRVSGPISVLGFCFSTDGKVLGESRAFATPQNAEPGGQVSFEMTLNNGEPCPVYLVSGSGFDF